MPIYVLNTIMGWLIILIAFEAHGSTKLLCVGPLNHSAHYYINKPNKPFFFPLGKKHVYMGICVVFGWVGVVCCVCRMECSHRVSSSIFLLALVFVFLKQLEFNGRA